MKDPNFISSENEDQDRNLGDSSREDILNSLHEKVFSNLNINDINMEDQEDLVREAINNSVDSLSELELQQVYDSLNDDTGISDHPGHFHFNNF